MVGRQTPILSLVVPLVLVFVVDGRRGVRQTWLAALVAGLTFGGAQFAAANYVSVPLTDVIASLVSAAAVVALLRVWRPAQAPDDAEDTRSEENAAGTSVPGPRRAQPEAGPGTAAVATATTTAGTTTAVIRDTGPEVARAYAPYLVIIVLFAVTNINVIKNALAKSPWTVKFRWPGLDVVDAKGKAVSSATFTLNWLPAAGTLMVIAGVITALILGIGARRALKSYVDTYVGLRHAIVTVMAVLALAYVLNQSGQTNTLGAALAAAGGVFVFLSAILGWLGVAVTGSDTSSNALFGALQVQTAAGAHLDPLLLAAANSSGGVLGKMISPQNLAIAASAVGMAGKEGEIFRKVIGWSVALLAFMCVIVVLQHTPVLSWMVP
jgi:lactate permease